MLLLLPLLVSLAQARPNELHVDINSQSIIGGLPANIEDFPWQLSLAYSNSHTCGAIMTKSNALAITAAHCVEGRSSSLFTVRAGMNYLSESSSGYQTVNINSYLSHSGYDTSNSYANDIAILYLSSPIAYNSKVAAIPLATGSELWTGRECQVSGWGRDSSASTLPDQLQYTDTSVISQSECTSRMSSVNGVTIHDSHICIYNGGASGVCNGDSGGPMNCRLSSSSAWTDTGVTSWVISSGGNCRPDFPQVYTRVSSFSQWLSDNTSGALP